jgi:hypothetical protein
MLDDSPLPPRYDVDECVAMSVDPRTVYVYWEVRDATLIELKNAAGPEGVLAARLVVIVPTWEGPRCSVLDREVDQTVGDLFERDLPAGCVVRAAIGWKTLGSFVSIAHAPAVETPPGAPSPLLADAIVRVTPEGAPLVAPLDGLGTPMERLLALARTTQTLRRIAESGAREPSEGLGMDDEAPAPRRRAGSGMDDEGPAWDRHGRQGASDRWAALRDRGNV